MGKKIVSIICILCLGAIVYGDTIGISGLGKPFAAGDLIGYDLHVEFETTKYVEGFGITGNQTENNKTYYQEFIATPSKTGSYLFDNYASSLIGLEGPTTDTQLLIYDQAPQQLIISAPWGFNMELIVALLVVYQVSIQQKVAEILVIRHHMLANPVHFMVHSI